MIDTDEFHRRLGAQHALSQDEQLMLEPGVRVSCAPQGWTAIFECLPPDEARMTALFDCCRRESGLLPFTTRSQQLALRCLAQADRDDTEWALGCLQACLQTLVADRLAA